MSSSAYADLVGRFCDLAGVQDVAMVHEHGTVELDGVLFSFVHHWMPEEESLLAYCDFGVVPEADEEAAYLLLLELNLFMSAGAAFQGFSLDAESRHVIFSFRMVLAQLDATTLLETVSLCADLARTWRQSHYLDEEALLP